MLEESSIRPADSDDAPMARISLDPDERRTIGIVTLIAILRMVGLFSLLPVLSLYAAGLAGATPFLVGLAVGAYGLTQAALQIPLGALSDRFGRVPVILIGLAVFAAGSAIAALSDTIGGVILGRFLQGAGAISATLTALIADATRAEVRTRSMAIIGIGIGSSFIVAMIFGPWFAASFGVPALFGVGVCVAIAGASLLFFLPRDIEAPPSRARWDLRPAFRTDLLRLDFYVFLLHAILTASFVALPFLLRDELKLATISHWKMYVGAIVVSLAGTIPLILYDERKGKVQTVALAVVLLIGGELLLTFAGYSIPGAFAALAIFFAGFNFLEAALPARLSLLASSDSRGSSLGLFSSAQFLGAFAGGMLGGRFLTGGEPGNVFFVCALLGGIWLALHGLGRSRSRDEKPDPKS